MAGPSRAASAPRRFKEWLHPRDWRGRFIEKGSHVEIPGGEHATVKSLDPDGATVVRSDGSEAHFRADQLTVVDSVTHPIVPGLDRPGPRFSQPAHDRLRLGLEDASRTLNNELDSNPNLVGQRSLDVMDAAGAVNSALRSSQNGSHEAAASQSLRSVVPLLGKLGMQDQARSVAGPAREIAALSPSTHAILRSPDDRSPAQPADSVRNEMASYAHNLGRRHGIHDRMLSEDELHRRIEREFGVDLNGDQNQQLRDSLSQDYLDGWRRGSDQYSSAPPGADPLNDPANASPDRSRYIPTSQEYLDEYEARGEQEGENFADTVPDSDLGRTLNSLYTTPPRSSTSAETEAYARGRRTGMIYALEQRVASLQTPLEGDNAIDINAYLQYHNPPGLHVPIDTQIPSDHPARQDPADAAAYDAYQRGENTGRILADSIDLVRISPRELLLLYDGINDGDPAVMDMYEPHNPLSGEFADEPYNLEELTQELAQDHGIDTSDDHILAELQTEIFNAFDDGLHEAYWYELSRRVSHLLGADSGQQEDPHRDAAMGRFLLAAELQGRQDRASGADPDARDLGTLLDRLTSTDIINLGGNDAILRDESLLDAADQAYLRGYDGIPVYIDYANPPSGQRPLGAEDAAGTVDRITQALQEYERNQDYMVQAPGAEPDIYDTAHISTMDQVPPDENFRLIKRAPGEPRHPLQYVPGAQSVRPLSDPTAPLYGLEQITDAKRSSVRDFFIKEEGSRGSFEDTAGALQKNLSRLLERTHAQKIAASYEALIGILKFGFYGGGYGKDPYYKQARLDYEDRYLGYVGTGRDRPIYGFVDEPGDLSMGYGDAFAIPVDNDALRNRTTVSIGDSLDNLLLPVPVNDVLAQRIAPERMWQASVQDAFAYQSAKLNSGSSRMPPNHIYSYNELQFHGGLTANDIAQIWLPSYLKSTPSSKELSAQAARLDIEIVWM